MKEGTSLTLFLERRASRLAETMLADRQPDAMDERPFVNLAGGHKQFASFVDTEFLGSTRGPEAIYPLVLALRRLGCPIVMGRVRLRAEERPGAVWVTFRCIDQGTQTLREAVSRLNGVSLHNVGKDVRVLVIIEPESLDLVTRQLDAISLVQRAEWMKSER